MKSVISNDQVVIVEMAVALRLAASGLDLLLAVRWEPRVY